MQFISKVGDIVMLEEEKLYHVMHCIEIADRGFLVIKKMKVSLESVLDLIPAKLEVVEEVIDDQSNYYFQNVKDEATIQAVMAKVKELEEETE